MTTESDARLIRFGDPLAPTRAYAAAWEAHFAARFADYVDAYRRRVATYWSDLAAAHPDAFCLLGPVEVVAVGTLAAEYVFARPSPTGLDAIRAVGMWEHPELDRWDVQAAPLGHQVRLFMDVALGADAGYRLVYGHAVAGRVFNADAPTWLPGEMWLESFNVADYDATLARGMSGPIDRAALASAQARLASLEAETNAARRGRLFEEVVVQVLAAHGATVEGGRLGQGEQIDVFVLRPFFAVVECRWQRAPLQPRAISDLIVKLQHRPAVVAGLYMSMSGFTRNAQRWAATSAPGRTVVLATPDDLQELLGGTVRLEDWWHGRIADLVRRYPSPP